MKPSIIRQVAFGAIMAAVTVATATGAQAAKLWKGYTFISSTTHPDYQSLESFAADIERIGGGDIRIKTNVGGSLPISGTSVTQAVGEGVLTFAHDGYYSGNLPVGGISMLPMLVPDYDAFLRAKDVIEPVLAAGLEKKGVTLLATYNFPIQTIWGVSQITSLENLKGLKMRVGAAPVAEFMRRQGAAPITLATPDVAPALERSVVDGITTASAGGGRLWGDLLHSNYRLPINYDLMLIIANKEAFDALSPKQQEEMRAAARSSADALSAQLAEMEDQVTEELKSKGLTVTIPSADDIAKARESISDYWGKWAQETGPEAVNLLTQVEKAVGQ